MTINGIYCRNRLKVTTVAHEMRMSHWVYAPKIEYIETDEILFDLTGGLWDLVSVSEQEENLVLEMRKYPGSSPNVIIVIDSGTKSLLLNGQVKSSSELQRELEAYV